MNAPDTKRLVDVLSGLRGIGKGDSRAWARALRLREQNGEELSDAQRAMWRAALNERGPFTEPPLASDGDWNAAKQRAQRAVQERTGGQA